LILGKGYTVCGIYRLTSSVKFWRIEELGIQNHPNLNLVEYDLTDLGSSMALVQKVQPNEIYNLAAQSFVGVSFDQPSTTAQITGIGCLNLLEAIRLVKLKITKPARHKCLASYKPFSRLKGLLSSPAAPYGVAKLYFI
jgi:GDPmannose 4,6-dehydratase